MINKIFTFIFLFIAQASFSQTWSDDIAEIFYDKCSKCHHNGGVAPFPLITYAETSPLATAIYDVVNNNEMPPWPPNNDFQNYSHDRSLTPNEKTKVLDWLVSGHPEGNSSSTPPPPVYNNGSILGDGDLEVQIPTYMSKATSNGDDYVCFALPSGLSQDRIIKAIEIIPGNYEIVHHVLVYIDPSNSSVTDTIGGDCASPASSGASLLGGYTPGSSPLTLPSSSSLKLGMTIPANSQIVLGMHYPEGSYGEMDSTKVIFHFYPPGETGVREVYTERLLENWNFYLPANQFTTVNAQYGPTSQDYSLLSVFPHMHLLGQTIQVYGISPNNDTLKLIDIPHWDFEWQDFYFYKYIQKAEIGSTFYCEGTYDNTSGNLHNPNSPPITVYPGLNTSDEMMVTFMHVMDYYPGDETYNLDSLMNQSINNIAEEDFNPIKFNVYPNPFSDYLNLYSNKISIGDQVSISIFDKTGKHIRKLLSNKIVQENELHIIWDGKTNKEEIVSPGLYFISININGLLSHQPLIKR